MHNNKQDPGVRFLTYRVFIPLAFICLIFTLILLFTEPKEETALFWGSLVLALFPLGALILKFRVKLFAFFTGKKKVREKEAKTRSLNQVAPE